MDVNENFMAALRQSPAALGYALGMQSVIASMTMGRMRFDPRPEYREVYERWRRAQREIEEGKKSRKRSH